MRGWRSFATAVILVLFAVIENTWLSMLSLPGAVPPITLVAVFGYSLRRTPVNAALMGFFAGAVIDLMPPSTSPLGVSTFAFTAIAFSVSLARPFFEGSILTPLLGASAAAATSLLLRIIVSVAVGANQSVLAGFFVNLLTSALYAAMLASFVLPFTHLLDRIIAPRVQPSLYR